MGVGRHWVGYVGQVYIMYVRLLGLEVMYTLMGCALWVMGCICLTSFARLSRLVGLYSFLDESIICNGMGLGGMFVNGFDSKASHVVAMGVARASEWKIFV